jgi:hypothetical protein
MDAGNEAYYLKYRLAEQQRQHERYALEKQATDYRKQHMGDRSIAIRVSRGLSHLARIIRPVQQREAALTNCPGQPVRTSERG